MQPLRSRLLPRLATTLTALALLLPAWLTAPALAAQPSAAQLKALEAALNGEGDLEALLESGPGLDPQRELVQRRALLAAFPDARWSLSPGQPLRDGRATVQLRVTGSRQEGSIRYRLEASQLLLLSSDGRRVNGQTVLREQSLLRSGDTDLPVTLQVPDTVLTGQRYDVDLVLDEPLDGALVAGGISAINPQQRLSQANPSIDLAPSAVAGCSRQCRPPSVPASRPGPCCSCIPAAW
ncbi:hypothetical protein [Synechococcus sp. GFB01]|uniref:hypothetical protein n=1 Tax=Synechococcus sp. GFB01 TaxID=1662190 RepID=UPI000A5EE788|nr:hypothetical protein [Synechococcus sp. GFB01]